MSPSSHVIIQVQCKKTFVYKSNGLLTNKDIHLIFCVKGYVSSSMKLCMVETNQGSLLYIFVLGKEQANF